MNDTAPAVDGQVADDATPDAQGQATEPKTWYDSADDEVKGFIQNKGWDDPIKAVTSYQALEKFQGADPDSIIKLPKEGEAMDVVWNKLGRPESSDGYTWDAPESTEVDEARMAMFKEKAHSVGITQSQFEALASADAEFYSQVMNANNEQLALTQEAELKALEKEWGPAYNERAELGRRFISKNIPDGVDKASTLDAIERAVGTATMLKLFANAGENSSVKEGSLPDDSEGRPFGYSPEQAKSDLRELMQAIQGDPERLATYNTGKGNDYDKVRKLNQIIAS